MRFEVLAMFIIILMRSRVLAHVDLLVDANILEKHAVSMKYRVLVPCGFLGRCQRFAEDEDSMFL
jgi:hypothetical protein